MYKGIMTKWPDGDYWVFGYGSLMWRPGFPFVEMAPAHLHGWRRDMCIHYLGTPDVPGLVSGLTPGGSCKGRAYRIHQDHRHDVIAYLDDRELVTDVYVPQHHDVALDDGRSVTARVYVADVEHIQFAGHWTIEDKVTFLLQGHGTEGRSIDYLANVLEQLSRLGIEDEHLEELHVQARAKDESEY